MHEKYLKNFDEWNIVKKEIDSFNEGPFFSEGEIWWCSVGVNVDVEIDGKNDYFERPVLILKKINLRSAIILPLTNTYRNNAYVYRLRTMQSSVVISQIKSVSHTRLLRKICRISFEEYAHIIIRLKYILTFQNETPQKRGISGPFKA